MTIKFIDIMEKDVYIEYMNYDFEYMSFTKAKKLILKELPKKIHFFCVDKEMSNKFLNSLLIKYKNNNEILVLK